MKLKCDTFPKFILISLAVSLIAQIGISQNFVYKEFKVDTANLRANSVQKTNDEKYLMINNQSCYVPEGIALHGCPISHQFIKFDLDLSIDFRKDLFDVKSLNKHEWKEMPDGSLYIYSSATLGLFCGNGFVTGQKRLEYYWIDSQIDSSSVIVYDRECSLQPLTFLRGSNRDIVLAKSSDEQRNNNIEILFIDDSQNIDKSIFYDSLELNRIELTHVENNMVYGVYLSDSNFNQISFDMTTDQFTIKTINSLTSGQYTNIIDQTIDSTGYGYVIVGNSVDTTFTIFKYSANDAQLVWEKTMGRTHIKLGVSPENDLVVVRSYLNQISETYDLQLEIYDTIGSPTFSRDYQVDSTHLSPVDFEFNNKEILIIGNSTPKNAFELSIPSRVFILVDEEMQVSYNKQIRSQEFTIYPNPSNEAIRVKSDYAWFKIDFYNLSGSRLRSIRVENDEWINLDMFPKGLYILKLSQLNKSIGESKITIF